MPNLRELRLFNSVELSIEDESVGRGDGGQSLLLPLLPLTFGHRHLPQLQLLPPPAGGDDNV